MDELNKFSKIDYELRNKNIKNIIYEYGTTGFRRNHIEMEFICYRLGFFLSFYSLYKNKLIGCILTASHNKPLDNGIKIVCSEGYLTKELEMFLEKMINEINFINSINGLLEDLNGYFKKNYNFEDFRNKGKLLIGKDNRNSGNKLSSLLKTGLKHFNVKIIDLGKVPTLLVFTLVNLINENLVNEDTDLVNFYYEHYISKYKNFIEKYSLSKTKEKLIVDLANGVGSLYWERINVYKNLIAINYGKDLNLLNTNCGSDYVEKYKSIPSNYNKNANCFSLSIDGDVDRLIYFNHFNDKLQLINGEKIICLLSILIKKFIDEYNKYINHKINFKIVTTAYSNGAMNDFINNLGINIEVAATGVKNIHHKSALMDIGIYYESNGHGTITINTEFLNKLSEIKQCEKFYDFLLIINYHYGDAFLNHLLIDISLSLLDMKYKDLNNIIILKKSSTRKVVVKHRLNIKNNEDNSLVLYPEIIQQFINDLMKIFSLRIFIRPSGTEDIVRIYMEGNDTENIDKAFILLKNYLENHKCLN